MARLRHAAVLLTGVSNRIGEATAVAFARSGARLALSARRFDRLQRVAQRCRAAGSPEVIICRADVSQPAEARGFVEDGLSAFDRIDILINNAAMGWYGRLQDMPEADLVRMLHTNLLAAMLTSQAALPAMLDAHKGVILNVAAVAGFRALPYSAAYSASKHALVGLSHALRGELSGTGVKVCVVYPESSHPPAWVARAVLRTARWPRRDVIVAPYRAVQLLEPVLGGVLDHALGEICRARNPSLRQAAPYDSRE